MAKIIGVSRGLRGGGGNVRNRGVCGMNRKLLTDIHKGDRGKNKEEPCM